MIGHNLAIFLSEAAICKIFSNFTNLRWNYKQTSYECESIQFLFVLLLIARSQKILSGGGFESLWRYSHYVECVAALTQCMLVFDQKFEGLSNRLPYLKLSFCFALVWLTSIGLFIPCSFCTFTISIFCVLTLLKSNLHLEIKTTPYLIFMDICILSNSWLHAITASLSV